MAVVKANLTGMAAFLCIIWKYFFVGWWQKCEDMENKRLAGREIYHKTIPGGLFILSYTSWLPRWCNSYSAEGHGIDPWPGQTKDIKLVFSASPLSTQHLGVREKTGQPRIRIMCLGKLACLPVDCCIRELALKNPVQHVRLVQSRFHHNHPSICSRP